ncbi:MAG: MATE family efflux transporter [Erysipelotrichaceae bacterium]|nr:MATE family efflux transporter [Erysipelotrichaceae bacterium]MDY5251388.1 MATE family efflux transporter [Erysipelotrichaceae bacterium]
MQKKYNLFQYTWPIFVELILQFLVGNVDQIMVNGVSDTAVSAISNANQILFVLLITFSIISLAITIIATQYFGSNKLQEVAKVYSVGLFVNTIFGLIIMLLIFASGNWLFTMMKVPSECFDDSLIYLNIINAGMVIQALYTTYVAIFRTKAWMKQTMFISLLMNIINIIGNNLLISRMGVAGAAISSVLAKTLGLFLLAGYFRINSEIKLDFSYIKHFDMHLFKKIMHIGLPAGAESICYNISQLAILRIVNTFGNLVIKTRSFANMFANVSYMFGSAISQAAQIIVGFDIGAQDLEHANEVVKKTCIWSVLIGSGVSLVLYLFSDIVFGWFIEDSMLALAKQIMFIEIFLEAGRAVNMTLVRSLQACGDTKSPAVIGMISMWGIAVLFSYIFADIFKLGLVGIWLAMCLDECLRAVIFVIRWKKGSWRTLRII